MLTEISFVSDVELAITIWRHLSPKLENRSLILLKNLPIAAHLEEIINQDSSWRISESELSHMFSEPLCKMIEPHLTKLRDVSFFVGGNRENGWLEDVLELKIRPNTSKVDNCENFAEHLDMISCLLSASIDQGDVWAATRLFSSICPEILPAVRKVSADYKLPMLQALFSYIMEASIQNNCGPNSILGKYINLLKSFDIAVDKMHDETVSVLDSKSALHMAVQTAGNFLLSTTKYACDPKVKQAVAFVKKQASQVVINFDAINNAVPNSFQEMPSFLTSRERICRLLVDRLSILSVSLNNVLSISPKFRYVISPCKIQNYGVLGMKAYFSGVLSSNKYSVARKVHAVFDKSSSTT